MTYEEFLQKAHEDAEKHPDYDDCEKIPVGIPNITHMGDDTFIGSTGVTTNVLSEHSDKVAKVLCYNVV